MKARRFAAAVLVAGLAARAFAQFSSTTPLPDGYNGHALIACGNYLYNAGGSSNNNGILDAQNVFYAAVNGGATGAWKATTALPEGVFYHAGLSVNGFVYVLGGQHYTAANGVVTSNVVYYAKSNADGTLGTWQTANPLPEAVFFLSAAAWNGTIYATGGWNGSALTAGVYSAKVGADGSLSAWTSQKPLPEPVYTHAAVSNGTLYVLGGAVNGGAQIANTVYYAKINADGTLAGWTPATTLPQPISNHAGIYGNGKIFVLGGWTGSAPTNAVVEATPAADGSLGAWSADASMPDALYLHAAAVSGPYLFVSGGADNAVTVPTVFSMPLPSSSPPPGPTDSLPPRTTLSIGAPQYAAAPPIISPGTSLTLTAVDDRSVVSDGAGVGVQSTQWALDAATFSPYSGPFNVVPDGAHWVRYYSVDKLGHAEATQNAKVAVDGTPPVSTLNVGAPQATLASGETVVGSAAWLTAAAQDPVVNGAASGVAKLLVGVDGSPPTPYAGPFSLPAADGAHTVALQAFDNIGNAEGVHSRTVYRDGTPPTTIVSPDGAAFLGASDDSVSFVAVDPVVNAIAAGVNHTEYELDGGAWTTATATLPLPEGAHALAYRSVDNVGNVETARTASYKVDLTAPQTTLSWSGGLTLFGVDAVTPDATLSLSAQDPVSNGVASGVSKILFSVDGGADQVYAAPFSLPVGAHALSYGAVDNAGNPEERRQLAVSVSSFLTDALAGLSSVSLAGGAVVSGVVRSNGAVALSGKSSVTGDVAGMSVALVGKSAISGTIAQGQATLAPASYDLAAARAWVQAHNNDAALPLSGGVLSLSGGALTIPPGDYYLKGLTLSGGAAVGVSGRANLFIDGPISIAGQAALNADGDAVNLWIVAAAGDVSLAGQERSAFNLYAPGANVSLSGGGQYAGRLLGNAVTLSGKAQQPSTKSLPAPTHQPGVAKTLAAAAGGGTTATPANRDGRDDAVTTSSLSSTPPSAGGFQSAGTAQFGPAPSGTASAAAAGGRVTQKNAMPSLQLSPHHALQVVASDGSAVRAKDRSGVVIPQGAVANGLAVTVTKPAVPSPVDQRRQQDAVARRGLIAAGAAVQYGPEGTQFAKPVTLEIPYDRAQLPAGVAENALVIHYWNPSTDDWEPLASSIDAQNQVVRAQTTHFSLYQIFTGGAGSPTQSPPAPGATLAFGQVYAYPNPARPGQSPTIHVEAGSADHVEIHIYDLAGHRLDGSSSDGARAAFDYRWDVSGVGSGVYIYVVTATQSGSGKIRHTGRLAVIK